MTGVKHMKWWGWGVDGIAFHHEDKPRLAPFVLDKVGLDITTPGRRSLQLEDLTIPPSRLSDQLRATLTKIVGQANVVDDDLDRVVHTKGKSVRDLIRVRRGELGRVPDVIVYPGSHEEVQEIVDACVDADAVLIPFGGGSNIAGSLEVPLEENRQIVSVDLGRLNKVLSIDDEAGLATIQAGALGPDLEEQLGRRGWTLGHFPDSFSHSTLGGWIATRSSGMQSDKYGDIAEITRGLKMAMPGETLELRPLPSTSTGPSVREMVLGSEGRLGVITEATVQVHRLPEVREIQAYFFPSFAAGLKAMHDITRSEANVTVSRVSDERETAFSFATQKKSGGVSKLVTAGLMRVLKARGWDLDQICLSFVGFEGSKGHVARQKGIVKEIISEHGGMNVGTGPGQLYDQKKFDTPYIRDFLLDRGAAADVSETAAPWSKLKPLYDNVIEAAENALAEVDRSGYIMCHLSHSYHAGACLYFTFAIADDSPEVLERYDVVKRAIQQTFIDSGGTLSHHHGVGVEHSPWMEQDLSPAGMKIIGELFAGVDPKQNLNPGKVVHTGRPGVSVLSKQPED
ncbi:alkyldihydroxyacetonephosphate synthase [Naumannella cuiyingiana]|uniref:Alkyldihydroxyacetonephosphate synthase n=1 Tax=Naumannella cuiyingiana TaxID=1347891 RepID=A0A7Z0D8V0_9ACTN|nr:FAD-binding oxidoreductase [Naumannella cuiyingiana]NYI70932.1 alkyldihydroxyacetonephosphate synthase [Naumannella cuiyingiana]